uniref:Bactericidal permeability-increasing protein n=1 Tax=Ficedula albicollis TaxID=59894 RepID=A0A803VBR0_FICAL
MPLHRQVGTMFWYLLQMLFASLSQQVSTTAAAPLLHVSPSSQGEFYSLAKRFTVPFSPLPLAFPSDHERMVYFGASSYFFNTAGIAYQKAGALVFEITEAMIPKEAGFRLDTSVFSAFIPQVSSLMYPNMPMKFRLSAPTAPFLTIGPGGISFQPIVDAQAYAILPNSSLVPLFLLSLVSLDTACGSGAGGSLSCAHHLLPQSARLGNDPWLLSPQHFLRFQCDQTKLLVSGKVCALATSLSLFLF